MRLTGSRYIHAFERKMYTFVNCHSSRLNWLDRRDCYIKYIFRRFVFINLDKKNITKYVFGQLVRGLDTFSRTRVLTLFVTTSRTSSQLSFVRLNPHTASWNVSQT